MGRNFVVLDAADYAGSNKFLQYFGGMVLVMPGRCFFSWPKRSVSWIKSW